MFNINISRTAKERKDLVVGEGYPRPKRPFLGGRGGRQECFDGNYIDLNPYFIFEVRYTDFLKASLD